ncbi:transposase [Shinella sp. S4-D37]|uniref:transposase n=1 Tax=Shinella sp. S4-D37 TaxID=3161999 RepID=UPI003467B079
MLYRSTDCLCRCGAPVKNLPHSPSLYSMDKIAPSKPAIKQLSGIVHALRCGGRWADCADVYGPKKTLYNRFVCWSERGIWEGIFSALAGAEDASDRLFIDSSCIKVHRCAGGGKGRPWLMVSAAPKVGATPSSMPSATRKAVLSSCS